MVLGIIPARAGSRRVPDKNLQLLGGASLLERTLQVAQASRQLDAAVLTTDILEAPDLARNYSKVQVPFVRPPELCQDDSSTMDVIRHVLDERCEPLPPSTLLVLLQPTSPFRTPQDVDNSIFRFRETGADSMMGVSEVLHHPADVFCKDSETGRLVRAFEGRKTRPRSAFYFDTGALYLCTLDFFRRTGVLTDDSTELFGMAPINMIDIDSEFDLWLARAAYQAEANCQP